METNRNNKYLSLFEQLEKIVGEATTYIESVILDYEKTDHNSGFFSDVLMIENYEYKKNPIGNIRKSTWGRKGIYVFIVTEDLEMNSTTVKEYCSLNGAGFLNSPLPQTLKAGDHFYQGSTTSSSLHTRLKMHYSVTSPQSAICLNNPKRIVMRDKLKVFLFPVRKEYEKYPFFIRMVEEELHRRHSPKTGSTRTF